MTVWRKLSDEAVPKNGRMYLVRSRNDRGVVWWDPAETGRYGWVAEGDELTAENITHWAPFPEVVDVNG